MTAKDYALKFVSRKLGVVSVCMAGILGVPDMHWLVPVAKIAGLTIVAAVFLWWQGRVDEQEAG